MNCAVLGEGLDPGSDVTRTSSVRETGDVRGEGAGTAGEADAGQSSGRLHPRGFREDLSLGRRGIEP